MSSEREHLGEGADTQVQVTLGGSVDNEEVKGFTREELQRVFQRTGLICRESAVTIVYSPEAENSHLMRSTAEKVGEELEEKGVSYSVKEVRGVESACTSTAPELRNGGDSPLDEANRLLTARRIKEGNLPEKVLLHPEDGADSLEYDPAEEVYRDSQFGEEYEPREIEGRAVMTETEMGELLCYLDEAPSRLICINSGKTVYQENQGSPETEWEDVPLGCG